MYTRIFDLLLYYNWIWIVIISLTITIIIIIEGSPAEVEDISRRPNAIDQQEGQLDGPIWRKQGKESGIVGGRLCPPMVVVKWAAQRGQLYIESRVVATNGIDSPWEIALRLLSIGPKGGPVLKYGHPNCGWERLTASSSSSCRATPWNLKEFSRMNDYGRFP